jgi:hypothetical protein
VAYTTPRPVESSKYSRPSVPAGTSSPASSTTTARVNGGTQRPTLPGCSSHSWLLIEQMVPTSVLP